MKFSSKIKFKNFELSNNSKTFIIAEAGVNHDGSLEKAFKLVDVAVKANVDAIKFQAFHTNKLIKKNVEKPNYQVKNLKNRNISQFDMLKKLEISKEHNRKLINYCKKNKINFISTPYDNESLKELLDLGVDTIKIASTDLTNLSFIRKIAKSKKNIILSSGMSYMNEVDLAVKEISKYNQKLILLQCTSDYPTAEKEAAISVVPKFKKKFKCLVGFSDHTKGTGASPYAVCLGAKVIEKHFTINKKDIGPDHKASLSPLELVNLVKEIRKVENYLDIKIKKPTKSELNSRKFLQKNLVAANKIKKGSIFNEKNIVCMRTGGKGFSALKYYDFIGKRAKKDYKKFEEI